MQDTDHSKSYPKLLLLQECLAFLFISIHNNGDGSDTPFAEKLDEYYEHVKGIFFELSRFHVESFYFYSRVINCIDQLFCTYLSSINLEDPGLSPNDRKKLLYKVSINTRSYYSVTNVKIS